MKRTVALIAALCGCVASCAAPSQQRNLSGHYQSVDSQADSYLRLEVTQHGETASIEFSASHPSGRGTAPDGNGHGQVTADGTLQFKFEDSFDNRGTGILKPVGTQYQLVLNVTSVHEPRVLSHYGKRILQQSSSLKTEH